MDFIDFDRKNLTVAQRKATKSAFARLNPQVVLDLEGLREDLANGADPNAIFKEINRYQLMLHYAMRLRSVTVVDTLLRAGANPQYEMPAQHRFPIEDTAFLDAEVSAKVVQRLLRGGMRWSGVYLNSFRQDVGAVKCEVLARHKETCNHLETVLKRGNLSLNLLEGLAARHDLENQHQIVGCMASIGKLGPLFKPRRWVGTEQDALDLIAAQPEWIRDKVKGKAVLLTQQKDHRELDTVTPLRDWAGMVNRSQSAGKDRA